MHRPTPGAGTHADVNVHAHIVAGIDRHLSDINPGGDKRLHGLGEATVSFSGKVVSPCSRNGTETTAVIHQISTGVGPPDRAKIGVSKWFELL